MRIKVLGSAAGGGFPQWNCNCRLCFGVRRGTLNARPRTQSSIAIAPDDGADWLLCNASPDILTQLRATPDLQPARALRDTGIAAVLLIDAQIDHTTGLCMLREHRRPLRIFSTAPAREDLERGHPLFRLLGHYCGIDWNEVAHDGTAFAIEGLDGLRFEADALISNAPPYSPHRDRPVPGDNIGLTVVDENSGQRLFYAPGIGQIEPHVRARMEAADVVLVDGTCWSDDEMIALGAGRKRARDMGHLALAGAGGMLETLAALPASTRKILIHINNTNPILDEDGPERARVHEAGVEIAFDGMEIRL